MSPTRAAALFASSEDSALGARVLAVVEEARAAHPGTKADVEAFVQRLGVLAGGDPERLGSLARADLWLAHATAAGCPRALAAFERQVFGPRVAAVARRYPDDPTLDDEAQNLRLQLVAEIDPLLLSYRGQGTLAGWISVALSRAVVKARRRRGREVGNDLEVLGHLLEDQLDLPSVAERAEAKAILTAALRESVDELEPQRRLILKLHVCDGLVIDDLAQLLGVHRATASRRLERARRSLAELVRARIKGGRGLNSNQVDSLLRLVRSSFQSLVQSFLAS